MFYIQKQKAAGKDTVVLEKAEYDRSVANLCYKRKLILTILFPVNQSYKGNNGWGKGGGKQ